MSRSIDEIAINPSRVLVVSDTHARLNDLFPALVRSIEPTALFHLGDLIDKGGDESYKGDFEILQGVLEENPQMGFVLVSGGSDSHGKFELYVQARKDSYACDIAKTGVFVLCHDISERKQLKKGVGDAARITDPDLPCIILHGHTHRRSLGFYNDIRNSVEQVALGNDYKGEYKLGASTIWFLNPGAFKDGRYAIIERKSCEYFVSFRQESGRQKAF